LSMALVAVMGLFVQSLANIARIDLGLEIDSVVTFTVSPAASGYPPEASARLFDRLDEELAASPLVDSATSTMIPLLSGGGVPLSVGLAGDDPRVRAYFNLISPGFFQTLGVRLLAGRDFSDADTADAPRVAIVTQRFAERLGM